MNFTTHPLRAAVLCALTFWVSSSSFAQATMPIGTEQSPSVGMKLPASAANKWSVSWGWNRSNYSNSDIYFTGKDHDFTISNVVATDIQTEATLTTLSVFTCAPVKSPSPRPICVWPTSCRPILPLRSIWTT